MTQLSTWGNSVGVRIPKEFVEALGLVPGTEIEWRMIDGMLGMRPLNPLDRLRGEAKHLSLDDLLARMEPFEPGEALNEGPVIGRERFWDDEG